MAAMDCVNKSTARNCKDYLVYSSHWNSHRKINIDIPPGYSLQVWKPGFTKIVPPSLNWKSYCWWLFHLIGVFRNKDYAILYLVYKGKVVHRSFIVPAYFRWPFMKDNDLQISSTWTDPQHRNAGIASFALAKTVDLFQERDRTLWYVTRFNNPASLKVCEKNGFKLVGSAIRTNFLGMRLFGQLSLLKEDL